MFLKPSCYGCTPPNPATLRGRNYTACDCCAGWEYAPYRRITAWRAFRLWLGELVHRIANRISGKFWE